MIVKRYTKEEESVWNEFVFNSKNGTFLFNRNYMDYHKERFADHSLMYYDEKGRLVAIMPGNEAGEEYWSHQGLTYGGVILSDKSSVIDVMDIFDVTKIYLKENGFRIWNYKQVPSIYHLCPAEEDEYALWRHGAHIKCCNIATTIPLHSPLNPPTDKCRRRRQRQASKCGFAIVDDAELDMIWPIIEESLMAHHQARPIHTIDEMKLLKSKCPSNIKCKVVIQSDGAPVAGVVLYVTSNVVHVQYGHATAQGYEGHVMDYLYFELINEYRNDGHTLYFDFGTSNEQAGKYLNENLVIQKEGFGGRGIAYKIYTIEL